MHKNNISQKAAVAYAIVALALIIIIALVYSNTQSLSVIGQSVGEYAKMQQRSDSALAKMVKDERGSLRELTKAIALSRQPGALHQKVNSLNSGKDSVVVHPKTTEAHHASTTTVEVARSRQGFFRRLADLFRKAHTDTVSVRRDSSMTSVDTVRQPVDISRRVARILAEAEQEQQRATHQRQQRVSGELDDLKAISSAIEKELEGKVERLRAQERRIVSQGLARAQQAHKRLMAQMMLLAAFAIIMIAILLWRIRHDVRQEQAYQEALKKANDEISRVMEQREQLLLTITHDIKAPAASISGFTDLLKDYVPSQKGQELLQSVRNSANHLSRLVADLLDYHRLESGEMDINEDSFVPAELFEQCIAGMRQRADAKGLILEADTSGCKGLTCTGDAYCIRQIADNLLSNAVKYTGEGRVSLRVSLSEGMLRFEVKDTGRGMTQAECDMAFQPFKRLKGAQGIEGTGLGLSIVSRLVGLLKGTISVDTEPRKGTQIAIAIPVKDIGPQNCKTSMDNCLAVVPSHHKANNTHHLLVLDDDPLQLQLLQELVRQLTGTQWHVTSCSHVTEALTALHDERPELMLMDIEMPEMKGTDVIRHIDHHNMTVIAMTAHDESIVPQLREAGFDGCLLKPVNAAKLAAILGCDSTDCDFLNLYGMDAEDRQQIMDTMRGELQSFSQQLMTAVESSPDREGIAGIAHKLLPLAKMLGWKNLDRITLLTAEHIKSSEDDLVKERVREVAIDIDNFVSASISGEGGKQ